MTIAEALSKAAERLTARKVPDARLDAEMLLCMVLSRDRAWLLAHYPDALDAAASRSYELLLDRRAVREPIQYITGRQEFWGLDFIVTPDVLIPRPETELVVESAIAAAASETTPLIVDLCTGSGCIAVSLARALPGAKIVALDRSPEALTVARANSRKNLVAERILFREGDLLGPLAWLSMRGSVDIITANPPYVRTGELAVLQPEVRGFEPEMALVAGPAGTEIAERIIRDAPEYLHAGGRLIMEMGIGQAAALREVAERTGAYAPAEVLRDLAGIERVIIARKKQLLPEG